MKNISNIKRVLKIFNLSIFSLFIALSFIACSDDEGNFEGTNSTNGDTNTTTVISINVQCTIPATISNYIELKSGDVIEIVDGNPTVETYHDTNGTKSVCIDPSTNGTANILRN